MWPRPGSFVSKFVRRYLFSPKSHSVINIIASVSLLSVAVPTAAIIIFLAMFEGLERKVEELYMAVDADIELVAARGQMLDSSSLDFEAVRGVEGVEAIAPYIEQSIMLSATGRRETVTLRGVDSCYCDVLSIEEYVVDGELRSIYRGDILLGTTIASSLGVYGIGTEVELYALNRRQISSLLPLSGISRQTSHLGGVFSVNADIDSRLAIGEIGRVQHLLNREGRLSGVAIRIAEGEEVERVKQRLEWLVGDEVMVRTQAEKHSTMSAILRLERLAILLIGVLICLVATFSIVGALIMLITEKLRDIATLRSMGASNRLCRRIFIGEGLLLTFIGTMLGTLLGVGLALGQQHYGWVKIPGGFSILESYPVDLRFVDVVVVVAIIMTIGWLVSLFTVRARLNKNM